MMEWVEPKTQLLIFKSVRELNELFPDESLMRCDLRSVENECMAYLSNLNASGEDFHIAHAYALMKLGQAHFKRASWQRAVELSSIAQTHAREMLGTQYGWIVGWVSAFMGNCFLIEGDYNRAIMCQQESVLYLPGWAVNRIAGIFQNILLAAEVEPDRYDVALFLCDWICLLQPQTVNVLISKYSLMVKKGDRAAVTERATLNTTDDLGRMCDAACACIGLRKMSRSRKIAEDGIRLSRMIADTSTSEQWQFKFNIILGMR